jgi:hypothetical protein
MIYLHAAYHQQFTPASLPVAVRAALGKPLRRAAALTQLALLGALAGIPEARRQQASALLWQSTSGPRLETLTLLDELAQPTPEPMPYDFLATQPAIAAVQIQPFLPGLRSATHCPLDSEGRAHWSLLLNLAAHWLHEGRYDQVLCAHLDSWADKAEGHWLLVGNAPLENSLARLHVKLEAGPNSLPDTPDFPVHLADWLQNPAGATLQLQSPALPSLAVEFARI